jgi:mRNA interferase RelE/StbE
MARYTVRIANPAAAYLERLDGSVRKRIVERLHQLAEDPTAHSKPLQGVGLLRSSRVGDFRIILEIDGDQLLVLIVRIGSRGQVYRNL